jgi:23S rRNA pseudouridine1911/1915/1917 synthase
MAVTLVKTLISNSRFSLVSVELLTGRTHQIRVHMQHRGTPILGDRVYTCKNKKFSFQKFPRQLLHARFMLFRSPFTSAEIKIKAPYPKDFLAATRALFGIEDLENRDIL